MPRTRITIKRSLDRDEKRALMDTVHRALVECLKIPESDRLITLQELDPVAFESPPGTTDRYTLVEIALFPGRSLNAKRALYRLLAEGLESIGVPANEHRVILYEVPLDNWGIRGGVPASDVDIGFHITV